MNKKRPLLTGKGEGFFITPNRVIDDFAALMGPYSLAVYCLVNRRTIRSTGKPHYTKMPSIKDFVEVLGLSRNVVLKSLKRLIELGLLDCEKRPGKATIYTLLDPPAPDLFSPLDSTRKSKKGGAPEGPHQSSTGTGGGAPEGPHQSSTGTGGGAPEGPHQSSTGTGGGAPEGPHQSSTGTGGGAPEGPHQSSTGTGGGAPEGPHQSSTGTGGGAPEGPHQSSTGTGGGAPEGPHQSSTGTTTQKAPYSVQDKERQLIRQQQDNVLPDAAVISQSQETLERGLVEAGITRGNALQLLSTIEHGFLWLVIEFHRTRRPELLNPGGALISMIRDPASWGIVREGDRWEAPPPSAPLLSARPTNERILATQRTNLDGRRETAKARDLEGFREEVWEAAGCPSVCDKDYRAKMDLALKTIVAREEQA